MALPDALPSQFGVIAQNYPHEAAGLLAFDILIGNHDHARNLKASVVTPHIPLFCAFDHSHVLLNIRDNPHDSIKALKSDDLLSPVLPPTRGVGARSGQYWNLQVGGRQDFSCLTKLLVQHLDSMPRQAPPVRAGRGFNSRHIHN